MLRKNVKQQLTEKEQEAQLLGVTSTINVRRQFNILLVFMFMMQLFLPIITYAEDASDSSENTNPPIEVQAVANEDDSNTGDSGESAELNNVEDDEIPPSEEPPAEPGENVVDEPINNPEKNTNEQPPPTDGKPKQEDVGEENLGNNEAEETAEEKKVVEEDEEEEEDVEGPGAMLDGFPATKHPENVTAIKRFAAGSLGSGLVLSRQAMQRQSTSTLAPGEVKTTKTAQSVPGMVNTWDITVRIEGRDNNIVETTDVVLVIDRSGSMDDDGRMTNAKAAAKNFIDAMIKPPSTSLRIAVVSFSSDYTEGNRTSKLINVDHDFSTNRTTLKNAVDGLRALGGTHTQAGIIQGQAKLTGSGADNKYMVLLSDGQPTFSYRPTNWTRIGTSNSYNAVYDGQYNSGVVVGDGSNLTENYWWNNAWRNIHNGNAAVKAGVDARVGFDGLFTIAVQAGSVGTPILGNIASPGMAYSTQNPEELDEIYDRIGTQIATQSAIRNAVLTDEMGDGFSLVANTLQTSEGSTVVSAANSMNNDTITWTIDPAVTNLVEGTDDVRYAEMTYRVEINDDILDLPDAKTDDDKLFDTNKSTKLTYLDKDDISQTKNIESPKVNPVLMKMKKILKDGSGNEITDDDRLFNVNVSNTPNTFNHTEPLEPGAEYVWLTTLRHEGTYNVEETAISGDGVTNLNAFDISYRVDSENKSNFIVNHLDNKPRGDVTIEVTNKQYGDAIPDNPLIRLSKTFSGLTQEQIDLLTDFKITITSQNDSHQSKDLFLADAERSVEANGDITYNWVLDGWPAGTYTVTESGEELENYEVIIENDGTVTTVPATVNWTNVLWKKPNTEENNDLTRNGQNLPPNIVATKLSSGTGVFVWTETRLSASERLAVVNALSGWNELGLTMENGYWYSGEDIEGDHFFFRGYRIQYDIETGNLYIPQPNQWALIVSGSYVFEGGNPADIAVKNTYTINTIDFSFTKVDENGDPLTGSEFTLEREEADETTTPIANTGVDPNFIFAGLTEGTYILTETKAPAGYRLPTSSWTITVVRNADGELEIQVPDDSFITGTVDDGFEVGNEEQGEFPQTGGYGVTSYLSLGILSIMSSIGYYLKKEKNGGRKNE